MYINKQGPVRLPYACWNTRGGFHRTTLHRSTTAGDGVVCATRLVPGLRRHFHRGHTVHAVKFAGLEPRDSVVAASKILAMQPHRRHRPLACLRKQHSLHLGPIFSVIELYLQRLNTSSQKRGLGAIAVGAVGLHGM